MPAPKSQVSVTPTNPAPTTEVATAQNSTTAQHTSAVTTSNPTTISVQCPVIIAPANGSLTSTGYNTYLDVVEFSCDQGYELVGNSSATCLVSGNWSSSVPDCNAVQCTSLTPPVNGSLSPAGADTYLDVVTFKCDQGYELDGSTSTTCQADGTWSAIVPDCNAVRCPNLAAPVNGTLRPADANTYLDVVTFSCDQGYELDGSTNATCQADGTWSANAPDCNAVKCPNLIAPANGSLNPTDANTYLDAVTFRCDQGYELDGSTSATCQADGTWSSSIPTCNTMACPTLTAPVNGSLSPTGVNTYLDVVKFSCDQGYELDGSTNATCQADEAWSANVPNCNVVKCPNLKAPVNGTMSPIGAGTYLDVVTFSCDQGYKLDGSTSTTCQADGNWSANVPTCNAIRCPNLTAPVNGNLSPASASAYPDVVTFSCDQGYELVGNTNTTCQADGSWTANVPTCIDAKLKS
ncbi:P-selectin-like [Branchiostoma lanceolatum]|uniref:P-selectin-like n=1 Tax=Branchiostoma lanceolatum TaxID=7740 RepID=UPI0034552153